MVAKCCRFVKVLCVHGALALVMSLVSHPASATPFFIDTGTADGRIATGSRPATSAKTTIQTADDFSLVSTTTISSATFTGLLTGSGVGLGNIGSIGVSIYRVFPLDSTNPPAGTVPTRVNSPSDIALVDLGSATGTLSYVVSVVSPSFIALNSVLNGINPSPSQRTGGEGPVTGEEVIFSVTFTTPFDLAANHYFFVPVVDVTDGEFRWLSAAKPIGGSGTPFSPDLQTWIRNDSLSPDWLRVGTDIIGGSPPPTFNASFSLSGNTESTVPEPGTLALLGVAMAALALRPRYG